MKPKRPENKNLFDVYPGLVDRYYSMNPLTEMLVGGGDLEEGMTVLLAAAVNRWNVSDMTLADKKMIPYALTANRWCKVKDPVVKDGMISFTGLYRDGEERIRRLNICHHWLVKRSSLSPGEEGQSNDSKRDEVTKLVREAVDEQKSIMVLYGESDPEDMAVQIEKTVDKIMGVFES